MTGKVRGATPTPTGEEGRQDPRLVIPDSDHIHHTAPNADEDSFRIWGEVKISTLGGGLFLHFVNVFITKELIEQMTMTSSAGASIPGRYCTR